MFDETHSCIFPATAASVVTGQCEDVKPRNTGQKVFTSVESAGGLVGGVGNLLIGSELCAP